MRSYSARAGRVRVQQQCRQAEDDGVVQGDKPGRGGLAAGGSRWRPSRPNGREVCCCGSARSLWCGTWGRLARTWTPPRPAKTTGGVRNRPPNGASEASRISGPGGIRMSGSALEAGVPIAARPGSERRAVEIDTTDRRTANSGFWEASCRGIASDCLRAARVEPGRIRAFSSDCLRSPLQPVLAGHSRFGLHKPRSEGCAEITAVTRTITSSRARWPCPGSTPAAAGSPPAISSCCATRRSRRSPSR